MSSTDPTLTAEVMACLKEVARAQAVPERQVKHIVAQFLILLASDRDSPWQSLADDLGSAVLHAKL